MAYPPRRPLPFVGILDGGLFHFCRVAKKRPQQGSWGRAEVSNTRLLGADLAGKRHAPTIRRSKNRFNRALVKRWRPALSRLRTAGTVPNPSRAGCRRLVGRTSDRRIAAQDRIAECGPRRFSAPKPKSLARINKTWARAFGKWLLPGFESRPAEITDAAKRI